MQDGSTSHVLGRSFNALEAAPVTFGQYLYRAVLGKSVRGRASADYQADLAAWMRRAQRGDCDADEAREIFSLSAAHWAFLAAFGIMLGMVLDYALNVSFDLVVSVFLTVCPAVSLASFIEALRAKRLKRMTPARKQSKGKHADVELKYAPIRGRWTISATAIVLLTPLWVLLFQ
ncbi:hypothetical protein [Streptomyces sp. NPDC047886]|uniref:hypothetical protein n=1 Tax=Streptomyces sp. NPDC047886 TaxID=3365490 RepID=UPI0037188AAE